MVETPGPEVLFRIITDLFVGYLGDGPDRPGGTGEGAWTSIIEFVMPVEQAEWTFIFTQHDDPGFTQTSMVTVENVTANQTLVSTTETLGFDSILTANVGDVIRVTSVFSATGTAPPNVSGLFDSGAKSVTDLIVPEPTTFGFLIIAASLFGVVRKRGGP